MDDHSMNSAKHEAAFAATEIHGDENSEHAIFDHVTQLAEWPSSPQTLARDRKTHLALNAFDIILCAMPLLLIVKIILCLIARQVDRNHTGSEIDQVSNLTLYLIRFNSQLTTVYTIIFGLIVSILLKRYALWKAQTGDTVAQLEQYQASSSLPSTVIAIFQLQAWSPTSLALIVLWAFYYIGSQANQYEYVYRNSASYKQYPLVVLDASAPSIFQIHDPLFTRELISINSALATDISPNVNLSSKGYDGSGYPLVPFLPSSIGHKVHTDRHGWQDVSRVSETTYSGWSGASFYTIAYPMVGDFAFNTSYINVDCAIPTMLDDSEFPSDNPVLFLSMNLTEVNRDPGKPRSLTVFQRNDEITGVYRTACELTTMFVEVKASCGPSGCLARKMRMAAGHTGPSNSTALDSYDFAHEFMTNLQLIDGVPDASENTDLENSLSLFETTPLAIFTQLSVPLAQIINSYYELSRNPLLTGTGLFVPNVTYIAEDPAAHPYFQLTTINGAPYFPQYYLSNLWITIDTFSNTILFFAAFAACYLRRNTLAPDIFGYVSSLTRDNLHMNLPEGGSTLSGMDRARLMKDVKVRIGDVRPGHTGEVGRIGLTYADVELDRLDRRRAYV